MAALGKVGILAEIIGLKERAGALTSGGGEDGRIEIEEALTVEILAHRFHDTHTHAQDRPLTLHADPQVTVVEREVHAVILE